MNTYKNALTPDTTLIASATITFPMHWFRNFATIAAIIAAIIVVSVEGRSARDVPIAGWQLNSVARHIPKETNNSSQSYTKGRLPLALINNHAGGALEAYITGLDSTNNLVMLQPDGCFYYPSSRPGGTLSQPITADIAIPLGVYGSTTHITIPDYMTAARIWLSEGKLNFSAVWSVEMNGTKLVQPSIATTDGAINKVNWAFVEISNAASGGLYTNLSFVDFVGLVLGISMLAGDGSVQTTGGLHSDAVADICQSLATQTAKDGMPWNRLCQMDDAGRPLRVIAPSDYIATNPSAFASYWNHYVDNVWDFYSTRELTLRGPFGDHTTVCNVHGGLLSCSGDNRNYSKPNAADIFGCSSGPFHIQTNDNEVHRAAVSQLCAMFNRGSFMMSDGGMKASDAAMAGHDNSTLNWYSVFVHQNEIDGKGYAFSYDDVNLHNGSDASGVLTDEDPQMLSIIVS